MNESRQARTRRFLLLFFKSDRHDLEAAQLCIYLTVDNFKLTDRVLLKVAEICLRELKVGREGNAGLDIFALVESDDIRLSVFRFLDSLADDVAASGVDRAETFRNDRLLALSPDCRERVVERVSGADCVALSESSLVRADRVGEPYLALRRISREDSRRSGVL